MEIYNVIMLQFSCIQQPQMEHLLWAWHWPREMAGMQLLPWGDTVRFVLEEMAQAEGQRQVGGNVLAWNNRGTDTDVEAAPVTY